jgi:tubulin polyglutamylase TTLL5
MSSKNYLDVVEESRGEFPLPLDSESDGESIPGQDEEDSEDGVTSEDGAPPGARQRVASPQEIQQLKGEEVAGYGTQGGRGDRRSPPFNFGPEQVEAAKELRRKLKEDKKRVKSERAAHPTTGGFTPGRLHPQQVAAAKQLQQKLRQQVIEKERIAIQEQLRLVRESRQALQNQRQTMQANEKSMLPGQQGRQERDTTDQGAREGPDALPILQPVPPPTIPPVPPLAFWQNKGCPSNMVQFRMIAMEEFNRPLQRQQQQRNSPSSQQPRQLGAPPALRRRKQIAGGDCRVYYRSPRVKLLNSLFETNGLHHSGNNGDWTLLWSLHHLKAYSFKALRPHQRVNQFPRIKEFTQKHTLSRSIARMQASQGKRGRRNFDFLPQCFVLPNDREEFHQAWLTAREDEGVGTLWIVKPAASACGRGIYVTSEFEECPVNGRAGKGGGQSASKWVVERYIHDPLLLNGHKFDLRLYVGVTSFDPLVIFLHEDGLCRIASETYDLNNTDNRFQHLTNYSVNKNAANFVKNTDAESDATGGKWSIAALKRHMEKLGVNTTALFERIEEVIVKTLISVETQVTTACEMFVPSKRRNCFELFGFDILIDESLRPWLLEVNFSPSLACDTPLDLKIKSRVISDLLNLAGVRAPQGATEKDRGGKQKSKPKPKKKQPSKGWDDGTGGVGAAAARGVDMGGVVVGYGPGGEMLELTVEDLKLVSDIEAEHARAGGFKMIMPSANAHQFLPLIETERRSNFVLANHFLSHTSSPSSAGGSKAAPLAARKVDVKVEQVRAQRQRHRRQQQQQQAQQEQMPPAQQEQMPPAPPSSQTPNAS